MTKVLQPIRQEYAAGEKLILEGAHDTRAYLILEGKVEITKTLKGHKKILGRAGRNEILGEMAFFDNKLRSATATALERTVTLAFPKELLDQELAKVSPWVSSFLKVLVDRARSANIQINPLSEIDYIYSSLVLLYYMAGASEQQGGNHLLDGKEVRSVILEVMREDEDLFATLERNLMATRLIGINLDGPQRTYTVAHPKALLLCAERLKVVRDTPNPLEHLLAEDEGTKRILKVLDLLITMVPAEVKTSTAFPLQEVLTKLALDGAPANLLKELTVRTRVTLHEEQDGSKTVHLSRGQLVEDLHTLQRDLQVLQFMEKVFSGSLP